MYCTAQRGYWDKNASAGFWPKAITKHDRDRNWCMHCMCHVFFHSSRLPSLDTLPTFTHNVSVMLGYICKFARMASAVLSGNGGCWKSNGPAISIAARCLSIEGRPHKKRDEERMLFLSFQSTRIFVCRAFFVRWQFVVGDSCGWCCRWPALC